MAFLKTFKGGVHPPDHKQLSKDAAITEAMVPELLTVPMAQHIGKPAQPVVKVTDEVKRGQVIGESQGFVSANVHSPVSGKVKRITECNTPLGTKTQAILIENDGQDTWAEGCNVESNPENLTPKEIRSRIADAGIVGMGGATFPTHVKLSPPEGKTIDTVLLNGVECEPYLTSDYRLMLESPDTIVKGLQLVMRAVNCNNGYIGVEANKPDAFKIMEKTCKELSSSDARLAAVMLEVKYPQGGEKQLIEAVLNREVPSGRLPMDIGALVQNVGSSHAIYQACYLNRPLTERIVAVTGEAVAEPANLLARIGTPIGDLLRHCRFDEEKAVKLICGGPMMGLAHFDLEMPVNKGMSGLLALTDASDWDFRHCIRCGRCVDGCAAHLLPSELSIIGESGRFLDAEEANVMDCIECGACTYVCPARRPIVQWIKLAKQEIMKERLRKAEQAKAV
ncbi:MAG: electron transport complex subunit RsxC [Planctomycetes bacterium]|nr:electron transport complex subunit RsxC [Planctomycetota bacterium]